MASSPPAPIAGDAAVITLTNWLDLVAFRGPSVPPMARYAIVVFTEAMGVSIPVNHPAVVKSTKIPKAKPKHAPVVPTDLVLLIEKEATNPNNPEGLREYLSGIFLLIMASLRFCDTRDISELKIEECAVVGTSINHKDNNGEQMQWATPCAGIHSNGAWARPLFRMWNGTKSKKRVYSPLFPHTNNDCEIDYTRPGTQGVVQAAISRIEEKYGYPKAIELHSPRNFFATCAGQLLYGREFREKLGRWAPGSIMPGRYDRAECATELRSRSEIIGKIREGWRPSKSFEIPSFKMQKLDGERQMKENKAEESDSEGSDTSETSLSEKITDLYDYV